MHFLRGSHGEFLDDSDVARRLEIAESLQAVPDQRHRVVWRFGLVRYHEREYLLPAKFVRHRGDGAVPHCGMREQGRFDFHGGDVLATPANDVLLPVDEEQRAICAFADYIAGMKPASLPRSPCRLFILVIPAEKTFPRIRPARMHSQLAGLALDDVGSILAHDAIGNLARRTAYTTFPHVARLLVGDGHGARPGFCHGPGLEQWKPEALLDYFMVTRVAACTEAESHLVADVVIRGRR